MTGSKLDDLFARRLLLVTGKGGVGKTTVSAALARVAAATGKRVLAAEISYTSPPSEEEGVTLTSPLAGALGVPPLVDEPRHVEGHLYAARLSPLAGHLAFLRDTLPVAFLADAAMRSAAVRRFFHAAPTLAELGIVYRLLHLLKETHAGAPRWQLVVCDLPATGHALALAQVPQTLASVLRAGPIHAAAQEGLRLLRDRTQTTCVLVSLHDGLRKLTIDCARVVLNRVPPNPFTPEERAAVMRIVTDRVRTLGARRLPRIDRAEAAYARLARELRLPVSAVQEADDDAVTHVARELGGAA